MTNKLTIRHVAEQTEINLHTLRYYERIGLITAIERAENGHRRYSPDDVAWLKFLKRLKATGMSLAEMKKFALLRRQGAPTVRTRQQMLIAHQHHVESQIATLQENLQAIASKIQRLEQQTADGEQQEG